MIRANMNKDKEIVAPVLNHHIMKAYGAVETTLKIGLCSQHFLSSCIIREALAAVLNESP
jgi:hypothetical protein